MSSQHPPSEVMVGFINAHREQPIVVRTSDGVVATSPMVAASGRAR